MLSDMSTLAFDCQPTLKSKFNGILTPEMIPIIFSLPGSSTVIIFCCRFLLLAMLDRASFTGLFTHPTITAFGFLCKFIYDASTDEKMESTIQPVVRVLEVISVRYLNELTETKSFHHAIQRILGAIYHIADAYIVRSKGTLSDLQRLLRLSVTLLSTKTPHSPETTIEFQFMAVLVRTRHVPKLLTVSEDLIEFFSR
ncbi:hypothetical protein HDU79_003347 [Rhizoclosmatium sp. JEL0117]|nr:hypothetical protein HDU79_003347 [Rhizoclosmatium sp. JEL0117]